jgi:hypothetical protein
MTADARPLPVPASLATPVHALAERSRLFPKRLRATPLRAQASEALLPAETERAWLLSRLMVQHVGLEHQIREEAARPHPDAEMLRSLKRAKLLICDRIAALGRHP